MKHDFESWLPKMSDSGVVILDDSNVWEDGFGVWKLVDEINLKYPGFSFNFGKGLSVLCTGKTYPTAFFSL